MVIELYSLDGVQSYEYSIYGCTSTVQYTGTVLPGTVQAGRDCIHTVRSRTAYNHIIISYCSDDYAVVEVVEVVHH